MAARDLSALFLDITEQPLPSAARGLAVSGVPVFPVAPRAKVPLIRNGRGFRDATTDLGQVEAWWRRFPHANIGIPTGAASGLVVVDVDVHGTNGYDALNRADQAGLVAGWKFLVRSPTGGLHLYYPAADEMEQRSWQAGNAGIDFRGDGGYIVAPPSLRVIDGATVPYRITEVGTDPAHPLDAGRLRRFLEPPRPPRRFPPRLRGQGRTDPQKLANWLGGERTDRNRKLFWASCVLAEEGVPYRDALDAMLTVEQPDFGSREITRTVTSGYKRIDGTPAPAGETRASHPVPARDAAPEQRLAPARGLG
ncbi:bifunctional DNA primase/polymerase [Brachybacterium massiliense]|uniref:bifunctional DNA primase/polymerase n=1 Tax=Brachybacterium massiliense TaxID=1755098 RepID=UPI000B3BC295|nr:bifunctional DNA primase/polymerase [Brachybacterium massiliense]